MPCLRAARSAVLAGLTRFHWQHLLLASLATKNTHATGSVRVGLHWHRVSSRLHCTLASLLFSVRQHSDLGQPPCPCMVLVPTAHFADLGLERSMLNGKRGAAAALVKSSGSWVHHIERYVARVPSVCRRALARVDGRVERGCRRV